MSTKLQNLKNSTNSNIESFGSLLTHFENFMRIRSFIRNNLVFVLPQYI